MDRARLTPRVSLSILTALVLTVFAAGAARAQSDLAQTSYYDVASSVLPSASGWGGPGFSGGAGDELLRIVNPTHNGINAPGWLCAMVYVFDDLEQLQECCGCPLSADQLLTLSVINDLTNNFGVKGGDRVAGVIDVLSSSANLPVTPGMTLPSGANVVPNNSVSPFACNPGAALILTPTLRSSLSHPETSAPVFPSTAFTTATSVEEFQEKPLDATELNNLVNGCNILQTNFTGAGICQCGPPKPTATPTPLAGSPITLEGCQVKDNTNLGGSVITMTSSTGAKVNDLVLIALDLLPTGNQGDPVDMTTITVSAPASLHLISDQTVLSQLQPIGEFGLDSVRQLFYWAPVTSPGTPEFTFTFSANVLAQGGVLLYRNTCLNDAVPCSSPIFDSNNDAHNSGFTVDTGAMSAGVPGLGVAAGAFANSIFSENQPARPVPAGGGAPLGPMTLLCSGTVNGGLTMADGINTNTNSTGATTSFTATVETSLGVTPPLADASSTADVGQVVSIVPKK